VVSVGWRYYSSHSGTHSSRKLELSSVKQTSQEFF
jgi:hypothetical protein